MNTIDDMLKIFESDVSNCFYWPMLESLSEFIPRKAKVGPEDYKLLKEPFDALDEATRNRSARARREIEDKCMTPVEAASYLASEITELRSATANSYYDKLLTFKSYSEYSAEVRKTLTSGLFGRKACVLQEPIDCVIELLGLHDENDEYFEACLQNAAKRYLNDD